MGVMTDLLQANQRAQETEKQAKEREREERKQEQQAKKKIQDLKIFATQELEIYFTKHFERSGIDILPEFYNIILRNDITEKITNTTTKDEKEYFIILDYIDNKYETILNKIHKKYKLHAKYITERTQPANTTMIERLKNRPQPIKQRSGLNPFKLLFAPAIVALVPVFIITGAIKKIK